MERGDLDRPTGHHFHLASAPSLIGIADTNEGRSDQNAQVPAGVQADTQTQRSRLCGPLTVHSTRYEPAAGTNPNCRESTTPGAPGLSERASNVAVRPEPPTVPTRLRRHRDGSVGSRNTRNWPYRGSPPRNANRPSPGLSAGRIESSTTANRRSGQRRNGWLGRTP